MAKNCGTTSGVAKQIVSPLPPLAYFAVHAKESHIDKLKRTKIDELCIYEGDLADTAAALNTVDHRPDIVHVWFYGKPANMGSLRQLEGSRLLLKFVEIFESDVEMLTQLVEANPHLANDVIECELHIEKMNEDHCTD